MIEIRILNDKILFTYFVMTFRSFAIFLTLMVSNPRSTKSKKYDRKAVANPIIPNPSGVITLAKYTVVRNAINLLRSSAEAREMKFFNMIFHVIKYSSLYRTQIKLIERICTDKLISTNQILQI